MSGRGAWPVNGTGGTRDFDKTAPGPYYTNGVKIELGPGDPDPNRRAVYAAVKQIQRALNRRKYPIIADGWFGPETEAAVVAFQREKLLAPDWGGVGPETARALLISDVRRWAGSFSPKWAVTGLIYQESLWDPGAVGFVDPNDLGLAQINGPSHPNLSERERLDPHVATDFIVEYLTNALDALGNIDDAIASFNLGLGGARVWVRAGRPNPWRPTTGSAPRDVLGYIENVKKAPRF